MYVVGIDFVGCYLGLFVFVYVGGGVVVWFICVG